MTLNVASGGYVLGHCDGEALWFSGGLLTYKATGDQTNGLIALAEVRAPQGTGSPPHRHHHEDEAWYVIDGELTFLLGDTEHTAGAGSFVFGPRGVAHRFEVNSSEARFLIFVFPAGFEHFTRVCGNPATARTFPPPNLPAKNTDALLEAARVHRIEILEPGLDATYIVAAFLAGAAR
jgi:quercetin dioxygenase-like cupin family protein